MKQKIIFFDMDGTLLHKDEQSGVSKMSIRVKETLKAVQDQGHKIFIATGRPYAFIEPQIFDFGFDGYVLANGAYVVYNNQYFAHQPLETHKIKPLVEEFEKRKIEYILQHQKFSYLREHTGKLRQFYEGCSVNFDYIKHEFESEQMIEGTCKIEVMPTQLDDINFCKEIEKYGFSCMGEPPYTFEIYSNQVSKASGILAVLDMLGIDIEDSYAFGDGKNDIEMLQSVGHGIAMGNASDEVKQHAKSICLSVDEDGVAHKLNELFLS